VSQHFGILLCKSLATALCVFSRKGCLLLLLLLLLLLPGIKHIHAMPIRSGPETLLGVLNLGFKHEPCLDMGIMGPHLFSTYLSLISATLTAVVRDPALNSYVCLARDLAGATTLDGIMQVWPGTHQRAVLVGYCIS